MIFLAADIGGTQTRLLLGEPCATGWRCIRQQSFLGHDYPSLEALLEVFLGPDEQPDVACIAVAGPLEGHHVQMTNLPWLLGLSDTEQDTDETRPAMKARELELISALN